MMGLIGSDKEKKPLKFGRINKKYIVLFLFILLLFFVLQAITKDTVKSILQTESEDHVLKIYSPLNERIIIPIIKEFQENTGIQVEYLSAGTMDLLKTLDNKEDEYLMDVMWGGSKEYLDIYKDLFEPYVSIYENDIHQSNNEDKNSFLGYNLLPIVLIYNTKLVSSKEVCKSWIELTDPKWKGKIAFVDPNTSGSAFIALSFMLNINKEENGYNWDNAKKLMENIDGKILAKSSEVYEGVAKGDFAVGITMEEAAISYMNKGEDVGIIYLEEGTPVITDSIALMKDAKNKEEAKAFIDFVLSKQVQTYMVENFYLRSIRDDVDVPKGLMPMKALNIFDSSVLDTYENKAMILYKWQAMFNDTYQGGQ